LPTEMAAITTMMMATIMPAIHFLAESPMIRRRGRNCRNASNLAIIGNGYNQGGSLINNSCRS
jgi:hypothetical protein